MKNLRHNKNVSIIVAYTIGLMYDKYIMYRILYKKRDSR